MFRPESLAFLRFRSVYGGSCRNMFCYGVTSSDVVLHGRRGTLYIPCVSEDMCVHDPRGRKVAVSMEEAGQSYLFRGVTEVAAWQKSCRVYRRSWTELSFSRCDKKL